MSSGVPFRRIAVRSAICCMTSGSTQLRSAFVSTAPGSTAFTRTRGARSAAISRVSCATVALLKLWANVPRTALRPATEPMLTIDPAPDARRCGSASRLSSNATDTLKWNDFSSCSTVVAGNGLDAVPPRC